MHSEHRHHLQQNDLGQLTLKAVPWFEQHGTQLIVGVVGVLVLVIGASVWRYTATSAHSAAWTSLSTATTVDDFGAVADKYPGSMAAAWAHLRMGELSLESGVAALFQDRELGLKDLKSARESFEKVLNAPVTLPDNVRQRAMLGLARVLESTCDGDTGPVVEAYQQLLTRFPDSIYKNSVERKIQELQTGGAKEFYAWFHKQSPKPPAFPRPQDGPGAGAASSLPGGNPFELPPAASNPTSAPSESSDAPEKASAPGTDAPTTDEPAAASSDAPATPNN